MGFLREGLIFNGLGVCLACDWMGSVHLVFVCCEMWHKCRVVHFVGVTFFVDYL